jgi:glycosyltransferase involved in cell wall biosynthesis
VRALVRTPGVTLAAAVPDMAPELAAATVALVPMRAGTGLQNKVLEAMAVGTPVVATPTVAAALDVTPGTHLMVAGDAADLAAATVALLRDPGRARAMATAARALVERRYRWDESAAGVEAAWEASRTAVPASPCARQSV